MFPALPRTRTNELPGRGRYEEYHPYGSTAWHAFDSSKGVSAKRYRYTGMERDEETGLQRHGSRNYAPWLGRWSSADPIGLGDGHNRYAYVRGNPVGAIDPTGLAGTKEQAGTATRSSASGVPPEADAAVVAAIGKERVDFTLGFLRDIQAEGGLTEVSGQQTYHGHLARKIVGAEQPEFGSSEVAQAAEAALREFTAEEEKLLAMKMSSGKTLKEELSAVSEAATSLFRITSPEARAAVEARLEASYAEADEMLRGALRGSYGAALSKVLQTTEALPGAGITVHTFEFGGSPRDGQDGITAMNDPMRHWFREFESGKDVSFLDEGQTRDTARVPRARHDAPEGRSATGADVYFWTDKAGRLMVSGQTFGMLRLALDKIRGQERYAAL